MEDYNIHVVKEDNYDDYKMMLSTIKLCDPLAISNDYESFSYDALELPEYIGYFLTDKTDKKVLLSCVVNTECENLLGKTTEISVPHSVEISLLCSDLKNRVVNLAFTFLSTLINAYIPALKSKLKYVYLYVSNYATNKRAAKFYEKVGFVQTRVPGIYVYKYRNSRSHSRSRRSSRSSGKSSRSVRSNGSNSSHTLRSRSRSRNASRNDLFPNGEIAHL